MTVKQYVDVLRIARRVGRLNDAAVEVRACQGA
jgi:hypothetical protein